MLTDTNTDNNNMSSGDISGSQPLSTQNGFEKLNAYSSDLLPPPEPLPPEFENALQSITGIPAKNQESEPVNPQQLSSVLLEIQNLKRRQEDLMIMLSSQTQLPDSAVPTESTNLASETSPAISKGGQSQSNKVGGHVSNTPALQQQFARYAEALQQDMTSQLRYEKAVEEAKAKFPHLEPFQQAIALEVPHVYEAILKTERRIPSPQEVIDTAAKQFEQKINSLLQRNSQQTQASVLRQQAMSLQTSHGIPVSNSLNQLSPEGILAMSDDEFSRLSNQYQR
ncbi:MAG: hypothetical protein K2X01_11950 [Cyanobacteria bacterium]|nr:hypothetical protein [Cyanobacteriota bacterium]